MDASFRLARILPGVLHALTREGHRLVILVHRFTTVRALEAARRAASTVLPHTQVRRPAYTVSEMRTRLKGPEAERRFASWAHLHRSQEEQAQLGDMGGLVPLGELGIEGAAEHILARLRQPVVLAEPDPAWAEAYARESARLRGVLGDALGELHHIGSTSVPELPAKPLVDMMGGVVDIAFGRSLIAKLAKMGYEFHDFPQNTDRLVFHRADEIPFNLHLVEAHGSEMQRHLAFRDALRADARLRARYAQIKRDLAERFPTDRYRYTEGKSAFIQEHAPA